MSWVVCLCRCLFFYPLLVASVVHINQAMYLKHKTKDPNAQLSGSEKDIQRTHNSENETSASANETTPYYRKYIPVKRMPMPEVPADLGNSSERVSAIYDPSVGLYNTQKGPEKEKINLIILPLSTLMVMFMYACIKVTHWCGEDIRESDDKMLRFFLPQLHHDDNDDHNTNIAPTRPLPRRNNSVRSRVSQSTFRSNSVRSTDTDRSRRFCSSCNENEVGLDSPLAQQILNRQNKRYIGPAAGPASFSNCRRHGGSKKTNSKSKSRDSLRCKNTNSNRNRESRRSRRSSRKRREHELKLISMPLELHFSHLMLGRKPDVSSVSSPSSASPSTSTGLSESVAQMSSINSDSRETSMDSGAVALGSQSSSQTDVTSTADTTTTTTGFSSESMSSPVGSKSPHSPGSSKHFTKSKGFIFPDPLPTSKSFWEHRRLVCSKSSEASTRFSSDLNNEGFIEDSYILPPHGDDDSSSRRNSTDSSSPLSPENTDGDVDLFSKSPRSSQSSDTAATVRYSPSKSRRSSSYSECIGSHEQIPLPKSTESLITNRCDLSLCSSLPCKQDCYVLTNISPPVQYSVHCSRENEISSRRDFADSNKMRKSLSADVQCDSCRTAPSSRILRPQRRSLDIERSCYEMDCFKMDDMNVDRKWRTLGMSLSRDMLALQTT